jgi:dihydropteroate synthase
MPGPSREGTRRAPSFDPRAARPWRILGDTHVLGERTWVMGVLNVTPDSFSDGGLHTDSAVAARRVREMASQGARIVDIGGESTRPRSDPVSPEEQWRRIGPVLRAVGTDPPCLLSVDTTSREVAARALEAGAAVINDVSALGDPGMARLAAESGAGLILMHMKGRPKTMQVDPEYDDLLGEVGTFLEDRMAAARGAGVHGDQIAVDPGIGFGKTVSHNLDLIAHLGALEALGRPVLVGASRKSFLGAILDLPVDEREEGSAAAHVAAVLAGAHIVRAHDVRGTVRAVRTADALLERVKEARR